METKKQKAPRSVSSKENLNCLKATQLENKIKQPEKNNVNSESFRENYDEFIKKQINIKNTAKI